MSKHNVWMSVSDLMTGLMVIFLFIAIAYMSRVEQNQSVLTEYVETKQELHAKLVKEFEGDTLKWQMAIGTDLSMKFNNPTVLFAQGSWDLTPQFEEILNEFLPRYFDILLNDKDPYIANVILSQRRSLSVLKYFRNMPVYQNYTPQQQRLLEYWFTSNGLSYGKSLDDEGNFTIHSGKPINLQKSRRVEFKIITSGDEILENFVNKNLK